jgi:hypothetical protein
MKTNVQPGMLAYVVSRPGVTPSTPGIIGRIVYVEREPEVPFVLHHLDGRMVYGINNDLEKVWVVSAREPLPCLVKIPGKSPEIWLTHERRILDECLRPLLDPNLDVSDEEVKELYSTKEKECQVSQ